MNKTKDKIRFISLLSDTTFKYLMNNDQTKYWFYDLIRRLTGINIDELNISTNELTTGNKVKDYRIDLRFTKENTLTVIIEINSNTNYADYIDNKNKQYLYREAGNAHQSGSKYTHKRSKLICFNNYKNPYIKDAKILDYVLTEKGTHHTIDDLEIFEIYIPTFKEKCYNDDDLGRKVAFLGSCNQEELLKYASSDEEIILKELELLKMNDEFVNAYDAEVVQRKLINSSREEGLEQGLEKGLEQGLELGERSKQIEIINNMLKNNFTLDEISLATNLKIDEINNLISR